MIIEVSDELSGKERRAEIHRKLLLYAIEKHNGHVDKIANFMGVSTRSLHTYLRQDQAVYEAYRVNQMGRKIKKLLNLYTLRQLKSSKWYLYSSKREQRLIDKAVKSLSVPRRTI